MKFLFEFNRFSLHTRGEHAPHTRGGPSGEQKNHTSNS